MKALTGFICECLKISSSVTAEICSMITFIADNNHLMETLKPMKMPVK